jgi:hypothetical protein
MTTEPDGREVPTMPCRVCETDVPAGAFCGLCGAQLSASNGDGRGWLRIGTYGAAPGEHVLRISVVSSLFPHLPQRSRTPFRMALAVLVIALTIFVVLRWQPPLIAVSALGLPLLFLIYLYETDVYDDWPIRTLLSTAVLGVGLGIGWALLTGTVVAHANSAALATAVVQRTDPVRLFAIPIGGTLLMLAPAVLVRVLRPPARESLDGFVIGSMSAICFTAASTLTLLAPQFATGLTARDRPWSGLFVEAWIRGVAVPLTAAAAGGLVGAALWFTRSASPSHRHRWLTLALPLGMLVVLAIYIGLEFVDVAMLPDEVQLALHLAVTVLALVGVRIGLQAALLHEAHDEMDPSEPILCAQCGHVVPHMAFCPACGAATHASSRSSRTERRLVRPAGADTTPEGP